MISNPGGSGLIVHETEVFSGTSPDGAWVDLNLAGTIGAKPSLVILKVSCGFAFGALAVRKNGDTDNHHSNTAPEAGGAALIDDGSVPTYMILVVATDDAGIIEWKTSNDQTFTIDIVAYVN